MGCAICLASYGADADEEASLAPVALGCGHIFHERCIDQWFSSLEHASDSHCPQCKTRAPNQHRIRLYPSAPSDLDGHIRAVNHGASSPGHHTRPPRAIATLVQNHLALPSSSPERGDVLYARIEPPSDQPAVLAALDTIECPVRHHLNRDDDGNDDEDDDDDDDDDDEDDLCAAVAPPSPCADRRDRAHRSGRTEVQPNPENVEHNVRRNERWQEANAQRVQAERERATLRGHWPAQATNVLLEQLVQFHLALQEYVVSAHGLRLYTLPHAGRKVCAFFPDLVPRATRDMARVEDAIAALQAAMEETEKVRGELRQALALSQDGKKLFKQAEAAVAAERTVIESDRVKVKEMRKEVQRVSKANQEWGMRLLAEARRIDEKREANQAQLIKERQAFVLEQESTLRAKREAEQSIAVAQREADLKVTKALENQRLAEQAQQQALDDKAATHEKNLRMAHTLDRLTRKLSTAESKLTTKKSELATLQEQLDTLQSQLSSQRSNSQRGYPLARTLARAPVDPTPATPHTRSHNKRDRNQWGESDDDSVLDTRSDEESSLLVGPPRKKVSSGAATQQEQGYDFMLANLAGGGAKDDGTRKEVSTSSSTHMPASLFARPNRFSRTMAPARPARPAATAPSKAKGKERTGDQDPFQGGIKLDESEPPAEPPTKTQPIAKSTHKPASKSSANSIRSFLVPRRENASDEDVSRYMRQAVAGNATGSRHKVPSERRRI